MTIIRCCVLAISVLAMAGSDFDTSGIDAFWPAYDALRLDHEPSAEVWSALFATPGYAQLEAREHKRAAIEDAMRYAFMPSRAAARDSVLRAGGFKARSLKHLMTLPAARDSVARFESQLLASGVVAAARRAVSAYLPAGLADSIAPPPIALVFFADDGRGYPDLIVADLLNLSRAGVDTGFFAHELYHFYHRHLQAPKRQIDPRDAGIEELISYPAEEGIADQLDKQRWVRGPLDARAPAYAADYRAAYARASELMAMVDRALAGATSPSVEASERARRIRDSLPDQGRALGAFMAATIDSALGRPALVSVAGDPLAFWLSYDSTARASPRLPRLTFRGLQALGRIAPP